jgi:arabinose-5-phosphate isomerase
VRSRPSASRRRLAQRTDALAYARGVLDAEASAILGAKERLGASFIRALELMRACEGHIVVTGLGKPGFIAQKLSATLASTGVPSLYLHPRRRSTGTSAGQPGRRGARPLQQRIDRGAGAAAPSLRRLGALVIAITGDGDSPLARGADVVLDVGAIPRPARWGWCPPPARPRCTRCPTRWP